MEASSGPGPTRAFGRGERFFHLTVTETVLVPQAEVRCYAAQLMEGLQDRLVHQSSTAFKLYTLR